MIMIIIIDSADSIRLLNSQTIIIILILIQARLNMLEFFFLYINIGYENFFSMFSMFTIYIHWIPRRKKQFAHIQINIHNWIQYLSIDHVLQKHSTYPPTHTHTLNIHALTFFICQEGNFVHLL